MKEQLREYSFQAATRPLLDFCVALTDDYAERELVVSVRHVFYKAATAGLVPQSKLGYRQVAYLLDRARWAGLVDWDVFEDEGREPTVWSDWADIGDRVAEALEDFRLDRWIGQSCYIEVWCEKLAVASNLRTVAAEFHAPVQTARGYSSATALRRAAARFKAQQRRGRKPRILYLGDHDPDGIYIPREAHSRLAEFGAHPEMVRVGLTREQVTAMHLPSFPLKEADSDRAHVQEYERDFGDECWELDACDVDAIVDLVRTELVDAIEPQALAAVLATEDEEKARLRLTLGLEES